MFVVNETIANTNSEILKLCGKLIILYENNCFYFQELDKSQNTTAFECEKFYSGIVLINDAKIIFSDFVSYDINNEEDSEQLDYEKKKNEQVFSQAFKFLDNLIANLDENDSILNYYSLLDSLIGRDISHKSSYIFNGRKNSFSKVKEDLMNCLFRKYVIFRDDPVCNRTSDNDFHLAFFSEDLLKSEQKLKHKSNDPGINVVVDGFYNRKFINDTCFINGTRVFFEGNNHSKNLPRMDFDDLSHKQPKEVNSNSMDITTKNQILKLIIIILHEMCHYKIFRYALGGELSDKQSPIFSLDI